MDFFQKTFALLFLQKILDFCPDFLQIRSSFAHKLLSCLILVNERGWLCNSFVIWYETVPTNETSSCAREIVVTPEAVFCQNSVSKNYETIENWVVTR